MAVQPGRMARETVTIQSASETKDKYGEPTKTWSALATRRAHKRPQPGREAVIAGRIDAKQAVVWTMRYLSALDGAGNTEYRLVHNDEIYAIHGIRETERVPRHHELTTTRTGRTP